MRKDLIIPVEEFNALPKDKQIEALCDVYECNPKLRKMHFRQYVHHQWNPHPPQRFVIWWDSGEGVKLCEKETLRGWNGADAIRAFNCQSVREIYTFTKQYGLI